MGNGMSVMNAKLCLLLLLSGLLGGGWFPEAGA